MAPLANDTSVGAGFAPLSPLERTVLDVERWINAADTKRARPETGEDVKVMGTREGTDARLTAACVFVAPFVEDAADYMAKKARLAEAITDRASAQMGTRVEVALNAADDPARGSFYLTVTGTSAEAGDDGQVGRGKRVSGLITPGRAMTMEAAAGKNPLSHVGKLYDVSAALIAQGLVAALPDVTAAECMLVSRIGAPIDGPQVLSVRVRIEGDRPVSDIPRS